MSQIKLVSAETAYHSVASKREALEGEIAKLSADIGSFDFRKLDAQSRNILIEQLECMQRYSAILARRMLATTL